MVYRTFVGLDVHARSVKAFALDVSTGEFWRKSLDNDPGQVIDWCLTLPGPARAVYEAGPTGYGMARAFAEIGLDLLVAAPSKLPVVPGDRVKTDKRDARRLCEALAAGQVTAVWVPSEGQEAARDLFRCREDAQIEFKAAAHRLSKLLLRNGLVWDRKCWTKTHLEWIGKVRFVDPCRQAALDSYLAHVQHLQRRKAHLDKLIEGEAAKAGWKPVVDALKCLRGVGALTAFGLAVEAGDWERLDPRKAGAYFGLVPSERSSGESRWQGGITKTGNGHARRLLVEAAKQHLRPYRPGSSRSLQKAYADVSPAVAARAEQANRRLAAQARKHGKAKKHTNRNTVALARELAGFCRDLAVMAKREAAVTV
jgi:transposase